MTKWAYLLLAVVFRPNNIGLSLVKFVKIERVSGQTRLHISGVDCLSGTPVLDIKTVCALCR